MPKLQRPRSRRSILPLFLTAFLFLALVVSAANISQNQDFRKMAKESGGEFIPADPGAIIVSKGTKLVKKMEVLGEGGRVSWSPDGNTLAVDKKGEDGYYDIWIRPVHNGVQERCLTCDNKDIPKHNGTPSFHPTGSYIVFQGQNPDLEILPPKFKLLENHVTSPGGGTNNNLWIMKTDGSQSWKLTDVSAGQGVLHPVFSKDGTKLAWAEKTSWRSGEGAHDSVNGEWSLVVASFSIVNDRPVVRNKQYFKPGDFQLYETHDFTPDGTGIIFSAIKRGAPLSGLEVMEYRFASQELQSIKNLSSAEFEWDEHAQLSPDEQKIIWVSSRDIDQNRNAEGYPELGNFKLDYWIMNADGSGKQRLTYFNEPGNEEYRRGGVVTADGEWSPDGKKFVGKVRPAGRDPLANETLVLMYF